MKEVWWCQGRTRILKKKKRDKRKKINVNLNEDFKTERKKNIFKLCSIQCTIKSGYLDGALSFFFFAPQPSQIVGSSRPYCRQTCHFISFHKKKNANSMKRTPKWVSTERARHASISMLMLCLLTQELRAIFFLTVNCTEYRAELNEHFVCPLSVSLADFISNLIAGLKGWTRGWRLRSVWQPGSLLTCSQQLMCVEYPHNTNWTQPFVCTYGFQGGSSKPSSVVTVKQVLPEVIQLLHLMMLWSLNKNLPVATQLERISFSHSHCLGFMIRINDFFLLWTI